MNLLLPHIWKEWREQRVAVLGLAIGLPFLVVTLAWLPALLGRPVRLSAVETAAAAAFAVVLAIGTGLLPDDSGPQRRRFLERLPGGLTTAFRAKLVFFALSLEAGALYGLLLGWTASFLLTGGDSSLDLGRPTVFFLMPALGASLWAFAVSAWVPRGALAFPVACSWIALLCWPAWFYYADPSWVASMVWQPIAFFALCLVGSVVTARISFVCGHTQEGSHGRAAWLGCLTALPFLAPAWGFTAMRLLAGA
jgi:hypothetical protein